MRTNQNLIPCPRPTLTEDQRARVERALRPLGPHAQVVLHRVATLGAARVAYDVHTHGPEHEPSSTLAQSGLDGVDPARPDRRTQGRFRPAPSGHLEAWFYDEAQLLGRAVLVGADDLPSTKLRKAARALGQTWQQLEADAPRPPPPTTVFANPAGEVLAYVPGLADDLIRGSGLERLVASLVRSARTSPKEVNVLLHEHVQITARGMDGPLPAFMVQIQAVEPVLLAPDAMLTPTQRSVAEYAAVGATVEEISKTMRSGKETVRTHLKEVYRRLHVANRVELARALSTP